MIYHESISNSKILPPHCRAKYLFDKAEIFSSQPDSLECSPVSCSCFTLTNYTLVWDSTLPHVVAWIHCWAGESAFVIRCGLLSQVGRRAACQLLNFHRWRPRASSQLLTAPISQSKTTIGIRYAETRSRIWGASTAETFSRINVRMVSRNQDVVVSTRPEGSERVVTSTTDEMGSPHERSTTDDHDNTITPAIISAIKVSSGALEMYLSDTNNHSRIALGIEKDDAQSSFLHGQFEPVDHECQRSQETPQKQAFKPVSTPCQENYKAD